MPSSPTENESSPAGNSESGPTPLPATPQTVEVPHWVVYFQAALLGVVATTFFVFGLMVGHLTSDRSGFQETVFDCAVSGSVSFESDGKTSSDEGAVVFLLPRHGKPEQRAAGNPVSPDGFEPLNNPGIEIVHQLGGAVVRTDATGSFNVLIDASDSGIGYDVLVVSKHAAHPDRAGRTDSPRLKKSQVAAISTYYLPVERVIADRAIHWSGITARNKKIELPTVKF